MLSRTTPGPRCNIGPEEIARRRRVASVMTVAIAVAAIAIVASGAPHLVRLAIWPFATAAAVTWLQVVHRFCVRFGFGGLENLGRIGQKRHVPDAQLAADRRRALELTFEGALIGLAVTILLVAVPR